MVSKKLIEGYRGYRQKVVLKATRRPLIRLRQDEKQGTLCNQAA